MMFWHGGILEKSAPYFAERKHNFMGSICCDSKNVQKVLRNWKEKLSPYPELRGFMYTTWVNNYDNLDLFMKELGE